MGGHRSSWLRRTGRGLLLASLAVLFWLLSAHSLEQLDRLSTGALLSLRGEPLRASDIRRMGEVEELAGTLEPFTLWTQTDGEQLSAARTGGSAQASVLLLRGDSRLVLPVSATLAQGDLQGCIIDRQTSQSLFGHPEAVGGVLRYQNRDYTVRGVFHRPAATMLIQVGLEEETPMEQIALADGRAAGDFLRRHQLEALVQDGEGYRQMAGLLRALPGVVLAVFVLAFLWRRLRRDRDYPVRYLLWTLLLFSCGTACAVWLMASLPDRWIPSRWSDFAFWRQAIADWKRGVGEWLSAPRLRPDLLRLNLLLRCAWGIPAALCVNLLRRCLGGSAEQPAKPE